MMYRLLCILLLTGFALQLPLEGKVASSATSKKRSVATKKKRSVKKYDYIIVGLGSAGSILARKLTDDKKTSVLALETGVDVQKDPIILNPFWEANANTLLLDPKYAITYPIPVGFLQAIPYSEGFNWGGSATHNFLVAVRGTPDVYDTWAKISGSNRWLYKNLLPKMKALETYTPDGTSVNKMQRGTHGPISVTQSAPIGTGDTFLNNLSTVSSTPFVSDFNDIDEGPIGIAANQQFITPPGPNSHRSYSNLEFLPVGKIVDESGNGLHGRKLKILSNARVLKFHVDGEKRATSVDFVFTGDINKICHANLKKNGKLILCAGAVRTPKILLNSGVGPAADLEAVGIPVVVDSPNVGKNLQCQYGSAAIVTGPVTNLTTSLLSGSPYMPNNKRRIESVTAVISPALFEALPFICDPKSLGALTIVSHDPLVNLEISLPVYSDGPVTTPGTDAFLAVAYYKIIKAAALASGQDVVFPPPQDFPAPFGPAPDDSALLNDAKNLTVLTIQSHIVGTTRMAKSIKHGVVDGKLSVFGLKNVKIGDIGIEPKSVNGNTCFSAYYIAQVLAEILGVPTPPAL